MDYSVIENYLSRVAESRVYDAPKAARLQSAISTAVCLPRSIPFTGARATKNI